MIIDKIKNLGKYAHLSVVKQFLDEHPEPLENGKYVINDCCFVNVSEYETKEDKGIYEGHERYNDLQMLISGNECIKIQHISDCRISTEYNEQKDVAFYTSEQYMNCYLDGSNFALLEPEDLHNPCLMIGDKPEKVKKYVFKILV